MTPLPTSTRKLGAWMGLSTMTVGPLVAGLATTQRPTGEQWMFGSLTPFYTLGSILRWATWADLAGLAGCLGLIALIAYERGDFDLS